MRHFFSMSAKDQYFVNLLSLEKLCTASVCSSLNIPKTRLYDILPLQVDCEFTPTVSDCEVKLPLMECDTVTM